MSISGTRDDQFCKPGRSRESVSENICVSRTRGPSISSSTITVQGNALMPSSKVFLRLNSDHNVVRGTSLNKSYNIILNITRRTPLTFNARSTGSTELRTGERENRTSAVPLSVR